MTNRIDITSTMVEKGIEVAKEFLDRLVSPAIGEAGLLLRDRVALWRFNNQIQVLIKAKAICDKYHIEPSKVSIKLLCPLLEGASLEEENELQSKWANLLANMVDSEQNIQSHVFPHILSQISTSEFLFLEIALRGMITRRRLLNEELDRLITEKPSTIVGLKEEIERLGKEIHEQITAGKHRYHSDIMDLSRKLNECENRLRNLDHEERSLKLKIEQSEVLTTKNLRDFELSNIVRLGLAQFIQEATAYGQTVELPYDREEWRSRVDVDVEIETNDHYILTELGELFIRACSEKGDV